MTENSCLGVGAEVRREGLGVAAKGCKALCGRGGESKENVPKLTVVMLAQLWKKNSLGRELYIPSQLLNDKRLLFILDHSSDL